MAKLFSFFLLFFTFSLSAATLDGVNLPDSAKVAGKDLVLNGIGIRKATFLKVKVYYGGLYLEQKTKDAAAFLSTPAPKQIIMHFVREVEAKKLRDAFVEGMEAANKNHASFKTQMDKFNSYVVDVVKGDEFVIHFLNDAVVFSAKGKTAEKISGADFSRALLSIWFINPRDEGLRSGLLGL
ncbi:MAG: chalcone isomerase family protein [Bacteriovorax sp.]|jgi:hypothetical protein